MDNKDDGITLIALIDTIIVLIIISGVTIKKLTEDDEFIEEFVNETQYHEEATENEEGVEERCCPFCDETEIRPIPPLELL